MPLHYWLPPRCEGGSRFLSSSGFQSRHFLWPASTYYTMLRDSYTTGTGVNIFENGKRGTGDCRSFDVNSHELFVKPQSRWETCTQELGFSGTALYYRFGMPVCRSHMRNMPGAQIHRLAWRYAWPTRQPPRPSEMPAAALGSAIRVGYSPNMARRLKSAGFGPWGQHHDSVLLNRAVPTAVMHRGFWSR
jgi:hypothetical protein